MPDAEHCGRSTHSLCITNAQSPHIWTYICVVTALECRADGCTLIWPTAVERLISRYFHPDRDHGWIEILVAPRVVPPPSLIGSTRVPNVARLVIRGCGQPGDRWSRSLVQPDPAMRLVTAMSGGLGAPGWRDYALEIRPDGIQRLRVNDQVVGGSTRSESARTSFTDIHPYALRLAGANTNVCDHDADAR